MAANRAILLSLLRWLGAAKEMQSESRPVQKILNTAAESLSNPISPELREPVIRWAACSENGFSYENRATVGDLLFRHPG